MYKVLSVFGVEDKYCVSVEGKFIFPQNEIKLRHDKGNNFIIESIGMVNYKNINDCKSHAELILKGNIENIGEILHIVNYSYALGYKICKQV